MVSLSSLFSDVFNHSPSLIHSTLVKYYSCEIAALAIGAMMGVPALSEFCLVAALILIFDALYLFTVFVAVLTLKMEVGFWRVCRHSEARLTLLTAYYLQLNRIRASDPYHPHTGKDGAEVDGELRRPFSSGVNKAKLFLVCREMKSTGENAFTRYSQSSRPCWYLSSTSLICLVNSRARRLCLERRPALAMVPFYLRPRPSSTP